jgi:L-alanine-DL-glutamate epimerase-like enolase superfamily enzyme
VIILLLLLLLLLFFFGKILPHRGRFMMATPTPPLLAPPQTLSHNFYFNDGATVVTLSFETLVLRLRHAFGTSHSSTTQRHNALFSCSWRTAAGKSTEAEDALLVGYGESGLPPKKPKCYLADVNDCRATFEIFCSAIERKLQENDVGFTEATNNANANASSVFGGLGKCQPKNASPTTGWFPFAFEPEVLENDQFPRNKVARPIFLFLLNVLDDVTVEPEQRAARSGMEAALFDCWCKVLGVSFSRFANLTHPLRRFSDETTGAAQESAASVTRSFYTAALNESLIEMKESTEFGLAFTSAIKIKLDSDVARARNILTSFAEAKLGAVWSIDANAAWSLDVARQYVSLVKDLFVSAASISSSSSTSPDSSASRAAFPQLYMIEQPWAASFDPRTSTVDTQSWVEFRRELNAAGVRVYADESIATAEDVEVFAAAGLVDGVNIKIEKAGGIRGALRAACRARELGLLVWIGTMVSSSLGCCQAAHVAVVADDSDVDGGLLAYPDRFDGGFTWRPDDGGILLHREPVGAPPPSQRAASEQPPSFAGFGIINVEPS